MSGRTDEGPRERYYGERKRCNSQENPGIGTPDSPLLDLPIRQLMGIAH